MTSDSLLEEGRATAAQEPLGPWSSIFWPQARGGRGEIPRKLPIELNGQKKDGRREGCRDRYKRHPTGGRKFDTDWNGPADNGRREQTILQRKPSIELSDRWRWWSVHAVRHIKVERDTRCALLVVRLGREQPTINGRRRSIDKKGGCWSPTLLDGV